MAKFLFSVFTSALSVSLSLSPLPPLQFNSAHSGLLPARGALQGRRGATAGSALESEQLEPSLSSSCHLLHSPAAVAGARAAALLLDPTSRPHPSRRASASKCSGG